MATNMDTGDDSLGINDLLVCPVCFEAYKEPKTLSCLHTFCARCLVRCMNGYRRELPCPTCRRITMIPASGVQGLQYDYRIEQMKDMLKTVAVKKEESNRVVSTGNGVKVEPKFCDSCLSVDQKVAPQFHCIQCYICFCTGCISKHNDNAMFKDHQVVDITLQESADSVFCKQHQQHPVRYWCEVCSITLCTICTMNHDSKHALSPLDHVINRYKTGFHEMASQLTSKQTEIKNVLSAADAYKKSTESQYLSLQAAIQEQTEAVIKKVREQQSKLHNELKVKMEVKVMQCETEALKSARQKQEHISSLRQQITSIVDRGHPLQFLASYKDMKGKVEEISGLQLPSLESFAQTSTMNLMPNSDSLDGILGKLQDCIVISDSASEVNPLSPRSISPDSSIINPGSPLLVNPMSPIGSPESPLINPGSPVHLDQSSNYSRCCSSPSESYCSSLPSPVGSATSDATLMNSSSSPEYPDPMLSDSSYATSVSQPVASTSAMAASLSPVPPIIAAAKFNPGSSGQAGSPRSSRSMSSHKRLVLNSKLRVDKRKIRDPVTLRSSVDISPPKRMTASPALTMLESLRLMFRVDGVGGWPGKVMVPCSATFLDNSRLVVAEKENRLQIFNFSGQSTSVFGWGQVRPWSVTTQNGQILVTDGMLKCVKVLTPEGQVTSTWGQGLIDPTDIATMSPNKVVVVDSSTRLAHIYSTDGKRIREFPINVGLFEQFNNLGSLHVAVDPWQRIIISDSGQHCIKIFDDKGNFINKFGSHGSKSGQFRKPHGVCVDVQGNIIVADHCNKRVSLFSSNGLFLRNILTSAEGMKCPFGVATDDRGHLVVTETHQSSAVMSNTHHTVSLYKMGE